MILSESAAPSSAGKRQSRANYAAEHERMVQWLNETVEAAQAEPRTEIVTVTPALASLLLEKNADNRTVSQVTLDRIKRDIINGNWVFNGEAIVVSKDGKLNDGQHRLRAVVETGRSIKAVLVVGPERSSRMTLDIGVQRTVGHFLKMHGYSDTTSLGTVANYIWQWKERGQVSTHSDARPTKAENLHVVEHYRDIPESLNFVSRKGVGAICPKSILAFAHWAIWKTAGQYAANEFIDRLIEGTELKRDNPILYARNRLIEMRGSAKVSDKIELIFRAWNYFRRGETRVSRIVILGRLPTLEA